MNAPVPHFRIPLNLPHAGTLAGRVKYYFRSSPEARHADSLIDELVALLAPYRQAGENPPSEEAQQVVELAARLGRAIVLEIERLKNGHDRLGQAVRNLFECLGLGEEGATLSLRAGENPGSALRPR